MNALPCPFCGGEATLNRVRQDHRIIIMGKDDMSAPAWYWYSCSKCDASTGYHAETKRTALRRWNKRSANAGGIR